MGWSVREMVSSMRFVSVRREEMVLASRALGMMR